MVKKLNKDCFMIQKNDSQDSRFCFGWNNASSKILDKSMETVDERNLASEVRMNRCFMVGSGREIKLFHMTLKW